MVSRSIGDAPLGTVLTAEPYITSKQIDSQDEFVIIASDGLWDVCKPQEACEFVSDWFQNNNQVTENFCEISCLNKQDSNKMNESNEKAAKNIAAALVELANSRNTKDNVTVLIAFLHEQGTGLRKDKADTVVN